MEFSYGQPFLILVCTSQQTIKSTTWTIMREDSHFGFHLLETVSGKSSSASRGWSIIGFYCLCRVVFPSDESETTRKIILRMTASVKICHLFLSQTITNKVRGQDWFLVKGTELTSNYQARSTGGISAKTRTVSEVRDHINQISNGVFQFTWRNPSTSTRKSTNSIRHQMMSCKLHLSASMPRKKPCWPCKSCHREGNKMKIIEEKGMRHTQKLLSSAHGKLSGERCTHSSATERSCKKSRPRKSCWKIPCSGELGSLMNTSGASLLLQSPHQLKSYTWLAFHTANEKIYNNHKNDNTASLLCSLYLALKSGTFTYS